MFRSILRALASIGSPQTKTPQARRLKKLRIEALESRSMLAGLGIPDQIGVVREGQFFLDDGDGQWQGTQQTDTGSRFGGPSDVPIAGDLNGDTLDEIGSFRDGVFHFDENGNGQWDGPNRDGRYRFGGRGDKPVIGDFDGDGKDEFGIFRAGRFYIDSNGNRQWDGPTGGDDIFAFGGTAHLPVVGDWDGDGKDNLGTFHDGVFYLDYNGNGQWDRVSGGDRRHIFGMFSDHPIATDLNGTGRDQIGVRRNGTFLVDSNGDGKWDPERDLVRAFGSPQDRSVIGNWNNSDQVVGKVRNDLAQRLGVATSEIAVIDTKWARIVNNNFHTPPWVFAIWAGAPGWEITLEHNGEQYDYQSDKRGNFVFNANPTNQQVGTLVNLARADLSQRFNIPINEIAVASIQARQWPDGCLGLGGETACTQAIVPGYRIGLRRQVAGEDSIYGDHYYYRASLTNVVFESQMISPNVSFTPTSAANHVSRHDATQFNLNFSNVSSNNSNGDGIQIGNNQGTSSLNIGSTSIVGANGTGINIGNIQNGGAGTDVTISFGTTNIDATNGIRIQDNNDRDTGTVSVTFNNLVVNATGGVGFSVDDNNDGTFGGTNATVNLAGLPVITATGGAAVDITGGTGQTNSAVGWIFQSVSSTNSTSNGVSLSGLNNSFTVNGNINITLPTGDGVVIQNTSQDVTLNNTNVAGSNANGVDVSGFTGSLLLLGGSINNHNGGNAVEIQNGSNAANLVFRALMISFGGASAGQTGLNVNSGDGNVEISDVLVDFNGIAGGTGIFVQGNGSPNGLNLGTGISSNNVTLNAGPGSLNFNLNNGTQITGVIIVDGTTFNP